MARNFNVVARHSLEKKAAQHSDVFTTVSDLTAQECRQFLGRKVDIVTPNGFEPSFTPSTQEEYDALPASKTTDGKEYIIVDTHCQLKSYQQLFLSSNAAALATELNTCSE